MDAKKIELKQFKNPAIVYAILQEVDNYPRLEDS